MTTTPVAMPAPPPTTTQKKMIYRFGRSGTEGDASQRDLLGGKGANLAEMISIGLPVPPGFTITTEVCAAYDRGSGGSDTRSASAAST